MKKWKRAMRQCPLAICILCVWGVLAAGKYLPDLKQQAGQRREQENAQEVPEELTAYGAYGGALAANRAPELTREELAGKEPELLPEGEPEEDAPVALDDGEGAGAGEEPQEASQEEVPGEKSGGAKGGAPEKVKPEYITYDKKKTDSPYYTDPGKIPLTTEYDYVKVSDDYFDDAVFIGDSRMEGMEDYAGLHNTTFFAKPGLTVYDLLDDKFIKDADSGKKVSIGDMLKRHTYGKIYLMVGINELGTGGTDRFAQAYQDVLQKLRKWQPDAVIYVHSIMGVSPAKDKSDPVFNNTNIRDKNYAISKLTDGIHIFYFNIQQLFEDENHALAQELTFDDVHLYAKHYARWTDYLREHAVEEKKQ